ncbi:MAG: hypothetical protein ACYDCK_14700 [Thermoplasmatota archaeon]
MGATVAIAGLSYASSQYYSSEKDPYCEDHPTYTNSNPTIQQWGRDQPALGYDQAPLPNSNDPASPLYQNPAGASERTCEGEQWDGQDSINSGAANDPSGTLPCTGQQLDTNSATYVVAIFQCSDPDNSPNDATHPVGTRVSAQGDPQFASNQYSRSGAIYVMTSIFSVGTTGVFASGCFLNGPTGGGAGPELGHDGGNTKCGSSLNNGQGGTGRLGSGTVAWYGKDRTPTTALACAISAARVTKGYCAPGDCTQIEYDQSAVDPTHPTCGRDNTAITLSLLA